MMTVAVMIVGSSVMTLKVVIHSHHLNTSKGVHNNQNIDDTSSHNKRQLNTVHTAVRNQTVNGKKIHWQLVSACGVPCVFGLCGGLLPLAIF